MSIEKQPVNLSRKQKYRKRRKNRSIYPIIFFPLLLIYMEIIFRVFGSNASFTELFCIIILDAISIGLLISGLCYLFHGKLRKFLMIIGMVSVTIYYCAQLVYYRFFLMPFILFSVTEATQVLEFMDMIVEAILANLLPLLLMLIPVIALIILCVKAPEKKVSLKMKALMVIGSAGISLVVHLLLAMAGTGPGTNYYIYIKESPGNLVVHRYGLLVHLKSDIRSFIFKGKEEVILDLNKWAKKDTQKEPLTDDKNQQEIKEEEAERKPNIMDINFDQLKTKSSNHVVTEMHTYFQATPPTYTNEYTGMFEGYNLIFIIAEGFSQYVIDKEMTPTLYQLSQEGFQFTNFYNPIWGVSTSDGEYVSNTGLIPKSGVWSMKESANNKMPFTLGNQFRKLGYETHAYHNHTYTYYGRDKSHPNMGYDYKGLGNGLQVTPTWPESDVEMMELSVPEYVNKEKFHTYYMTVSGHMNYTFTGNYQAAKHRAKVAHLPYSDEAKAYLASQIELDRALENLLKQLEEAGRLDETVIALSADHYPYGLDKEKIDELAGKQVEPHFELYKNSFLLWANGIESIKVDKYMSSLDIIPTLSNLFGLTYDSRLMAGRDVFSDSNALIIFSDKSWITDRAMYRASTGEVTSLTGETIIADDVAKINQEVNLKFIMSKRILEEDYYRIVFQD